MIFFNKQAYNGHVVSLHNTKYARRFCIFSQKIKRFFKIFLQVFCCADFCHSVSKNRMPISMLRFLSALNAANPAIRYGSINPHWALPRPGRREKGARSSAFPQYTNNKDAPFSISAPYRIGDPVQIFLSIKKVIVNIARHWSFTV